MRKSNFMLKWLVNERPIAITYQGLKMFNNLSCILKSNICLHRINASLFDFVNKTYIVEYL